MLKTYTLLFFMAIGTLASGQSNYRAAIVGFYNLENLFDTIDTPDVWDTEFTAMGDKNYDGPKYKDKLLKLSGVIAEMGTQVTPDGLAILGVCEVENRGVLKDLVKQDAIKDRQYQIIHYDSPDFRGIDVALLYQSKYFTPTYTEALTHRPIGMDGDTVITRDVLYVAGTLDGDEVHIFVNHWPSRRGGQVRSAPLRNEAALLVKRKMDAIKAKDKDAKFIVMGDLNDDPTSPSLTEHLRAVGSTKELRKKDTYMFNPMVDHFKKGYGTGAYRDRWSLFDQVIINDKWLKDKDGYQFKSSHIFSRPYMKEVKGKYKGYPKRAFSFDTYQGGYSDHFPVYILLLKKVG